MGLSSLRADTGALGLFIDLDIFILPWFVQRDCCTGQIARLYSAALLDESRRSISRSWHSLQALGALPESNLSRAAEAAR
jgi:hypothetical protein